ncbi:MAG TPA: DUF3108 domain-containing protein [Kofleriaceae bacterium]|nr:DUF3108 domain-containing protein [Kofleriaceae bacterium]
MAFSIGGCGEPRYVAKPLPDLVVNPRRMPIRVNALVMRDGERLRWEVHHQGFTIGRAELVVSGARVTSKFKTSQLASMFARAEHELSTTLSAAGAFPEGASERAVIDGAHEVYELVFAPRVYVVNQTLRRLDGAAHTMHSALGVLRAWGAPTAGPGFLDVVHAGELYRLEIDTPTREDWRGTRTLKLDGRITGMEHPVLVTMWITEDDRRLPVRIELAFDGKQIDAELIED